MLELLKCLLNLHLWFKILEYYQFGIFRKNLLWHFCQQVLKMQIFLSQMKLEIFVYAEALLGNTRKIPLFWRHFISWIYFTVSPFLLIKIWFIWFLLVFFPFISFLIIKQLLVCSGYFQIHNNFYSKTSFCVLPLCKFYCSNSCYLICHYVYVLGYSTMAVWEFLPKNSNLKFSQCSYNFALFSENAKVCKQ